MFISSCALCHLKYVTCKLYIYKFNENLVAQTVYLYHIDCRFRLMQDIVNSLMDIIG
jgi:hypothetical protein